MFMFLGNGINFFIIFTIGVLIANVLLFELGKFFISRKKSKHGKSSDGARRSLPLAMLFFLILAVLDGFYILWLLSGGKEILIDAFGIDFIKNII